MNLRILLLSHSFAPSVGGIEVNSELFARTFTQAGHQVRVVTWTPDPQDTVFPFGIIRNPGTLSLLRQFRWADVIFENNPCLRLGWPNAFFRKPSVIALNTWVARINGRTGIQDRVKKIWLRQAREVISVSTAVRVRDWPAARVIGNPYRADQFRILQGVIRNKDFVFLGRLVSDKGAEQCVHALYKFLKGNSREKEPVTLTIVGDGPELPALKRLVSGLHLEKKVSFTGTLQGEELVACLNAHRFLLVPSLWEEPFGNVVLEGMACGCIPLVSDGGGLPEAVGQAGLLFRRGDLADLVRCMQSIYGDGDRREQLLSAARRHLRKHQPDEVTRQYLDRIVLAASQTTGT
ncbi:MAG TPA: glycosyltransferase family 4 protein [Sphingobacteriaceae bacterium]